MAEQVIRGVLIVNKSGLSKENQKPYHIAKFALLNDAGNVIGMSDSFLPSDISASLVRAALGSVWLMESRYDAERGSSSLVPTERLPLALNLAPAKL